MRMSRATAVLVGAIVALGGCPPQALAASNPSPERAVTMLNQWRATVRLPAVTLDASNTNGCRLHAEYYRLNRTSGHAEEPSRPGYTEQGHAAAASSVLAYGSDLTVGPYIWEDAPYHRAGLLNPRLVTAGFWAEHGISCMGTFGTSDQRRTAGIVTYPYPHDGQLRVNPTFDCNEIPNPCTQVPGNDGRRRIGFVPTVNVNGPWAFIVGSQVTRATLRPDGGQPVALSVEDRSSPRGGSLAGGFSLLPHAELKRGTWYTAKAQGLVFGSNAGEQLPFATTWRFRTKASFPAKLKVLRASVTRGVLSALFSITGRATGSLKIDYQSAGRFRRFTIDIGAVREGEKRVELTAPLDGAQARRSTGILNVAYDGNDTTLSDRLRLRAASGRTVLRRETLSFAQGRLAVAGTVHRDVSGIVRLRVTFEAADGSNGVWEGRTRVSDGRWRLDEQLPAAVASDPDAYLTLQFTGDLDARGGPYRGEQDGKGLGNLQ